MKTRTTIRLGAVIIAIAAAAFALTASAGSSISPVADQIAFMSMYDGEADIYSVNPAGLVQTNLTHDETVGLRADAEPAWSPAGDVVAFERNLLKTEQPGSQIYLVTPNGKKVWPLTQAQKGVVDTHPSWAPDGESVVFSSDRDGNFELYVVKSSGDGVVQLTNTKIGVENLEPAWSPDGQWIVFTRQMALVTPSPSTLFMYGVETGVIYKLTPPLLIGNGDREAAWSPDSRTIAFASDRFGPSLARSTDLFTISVDGSALRRVTSLASNEYHPTWSPNGDQLAFISDRKGVTEIYSLDMPGPAAEWPTNKIHQLTFDGAFKSNPTWSGFVTPKS